MASRTITCATIFTQSYLGRMRVYSAPFPVFKEIVCVLEGSEWREGKEEEEEKDYVLCHIPRSDFECG